MTDVVEEGTGTAAKLQGVDVGRQDRHRAQVGRSSGSNITQPWFIGFAPVQEPEVAVAVTIEHGATAASAVPWRHRSRRR